jgi:ubiquinone/menaquinone biosynthesis C-methylase UbiE
MESKARCFAREQPMAGQLCPWWLGYALVSPVRRIWQNPRTILEPFVTDGMRVLEPGCGMGFFTIDLARMVGPRGRVVAVDLQPRMLAGLRRRAGKAGVEGRVETRQAAEGEMRLDDLAGTIDFALAFAVVHELPDEYRFFAEVHRTLRSGGRLLVAEPKGHVNAVKLEATVQAAARAGFRPVDRPSIRWSRAVVLERL